MRISLPRASIYLFIITIVSLVVYWAISVLEVVLELSFADALQTVDASIGIGSFVFGIVIAINNYLAELPAPPRIREFNNLFPRLESDKSIILRETTPHRVDFEDNLAIIPDDIGAILLQKIGVRAENLFGKDIEENISAMKLRTALVVGPSGCGKSTTVFRFCFELQRFDWRIFYSDVSELFTVSNISEIRNWLSSLRKQNLIVFDNIHSNATQLNILLETINDLHENGLLRMGVKIRILCIETRARTIESNKPDWNPTTIGGRRIETVPTNVEEPVGLGLTSTKIHGPSVDLVGKIPTLIIERGKSIAKSLLSRFLEIIPVKETLDFESMFSETGSVVEFCEVLRWIKENPNSVNSEVISGIYSEVAAIALERRLRDLEDREIGVLTLGIISVFSEVESIVSNSFLESVISKDLSDTIRRLLNAQHLLEISIGPAQKKFLTCTHAELARLIRRACAPVLQDLLSTDDSEVDIRLYDKYLIYLKSLPPNTSRGIGSTFLLVLSTHAAIYRLEHIADFVAEQCNSWGEADVNIKYSLFNVGQFYFKKGNYEKAEQVLRSVLSIDEEFIEARANLGAVLLFQGKLDEAIAQYTLAKSQKPGDALVRANFAQVLWEKGNTSLAIEEMRAAVNLAGGVGRYKCNLGKMLVALGRVSDGISYLREAIQIEPDDAEFYVGLSHVLITQERIDEAESVIQTAFSKSFESPMLFNNQGVILKKRGKLEEAKVFFERALDINPNFGLALGNLADYYLQKGNLKIAEIKALEALKQESKDGKIHALYAGILHRQKKYKESIDEYTQSISKGVEDPGIQANLAIAYYEIGELDKSDDSAARALKTLKASKQIRLSLIHYYLFKKDFARAKSTLSFLESEDIDADYSFMLSSLADGAFQSENLVIAEWALETLLLKKANQPRIWSNLGVVRMKLAKHSEAKTCFKKALELDSNDPDSWLNMGSVLRQLGELDESKKAFDMARKLSESH